MARVLLGVTGGIASYKALEFTRLAIKAGHSVRVIMTPNATSFVGAQSFAAISGAPVLIKESDSDPLRGVFPDEKLPDHLPLSHLELANRADLFVIAPASANTIAKIANGLADNFLSLAALACRKPLLVAPAMNDAMYENPATQANIAQLGQRGITILEPTVGSLGSIGEWGIGRMMEAADILAAVERTLIESSVDRIVGDSSSTQDQQWLGKKVLVTAGGTREPLDAIRFIGNRSSGRMGFALANAAADRGAQVTVIAANVDLPRRSDISYIDVHTATELHEACLAHFDQSDVLFMAAAVGDFKPDVAFSGKIKKNEQRDRLSVDLQPTTDVLASLAKRRQPGQVLVGFAAEFGSEKALEYGQNKLEQKQLDAVIVNDISREDIGFDSSDNEVIVVTKTGHTKIAKASKEAIADRILDTVVAKA